MNRNLTDIQTNFIFFKNEEFEFHRTPQNFLRYREQIKNEQRKDMQLISSQYIKSPTSQLALVLMAGGHSARYIDSQHKPKEIAVERLFSRIQQTIDYFIKKEWVAVIYVVCSLRNVQRFFEEFEKKNTQKYRIYLCKHHEMNVLDEFGQCTITDQFKHKLMYPSGVGNILQSQIQFGPGDTKTIREHMEKQNIEFVYCYGCANILQRGVDLILLGQILADEKKDMVFKCTQANFLDESLPRVLMKSSRRKKQPQWQVVEYENEQFSKISANKHNLEELQKSKVWMNHFVFRFQKYNENYHHFVKDSSDYEFLRRKIINQKDDTIHCIIGQKKISSSFMRGMKCFGVQENRQNYFPIITKADKLLAQQKSDEFSNILSRKYSMMSSPSKKRSFFQSKEVIMSSVQKKQSLSFKKK